MKLYTLAFIFDSSLQHVLLVHKTAPEWQVGKLNGVGGKLEPSEDSLNCIVREVKEETSLDIKKEEWLHMGTMGSDQWHMDVFTTIYKAHMSDARKADKEEVEWFKVNQLPHNCISNLTWLIPLALDYLTHKEFQTFSVRYHNH